LSFTVSHYPEDSIQRENTAGGESWGKAAMQAVGYSQQGSHRSRLQRSGGKTRNRQRLSTQKDLQDIAICLRVGVRSNQLPTLPSEIALYEILFIV